MLFDLDGTLIATKRLYLEAYRQTVAPHVGRLLSDEELLAFDARSERLLLAACVGEAQLAATHATFHRHYELLHETHFEGIYPGVRDLLDELRKRGLKTGIVTGKSRGAWLITEARVQLGPFDVIVVEDDMRAPKPDPYGLKLALNQLRLEPERALYVGDSIADMQAATTGGLTAVAALWSKRGERRAAFVAAAAQVQAFLAETPSDVLHLIRQ